MCLQLVFLRKNDRLMVWKLLRKLIVTSFQYPFQGFTVIFFLFMLYTFLCARKVLISFKDLFDITDISILTQCNLSYALPCFEQLWFCGFLVQLRRRYSAVVGIWDFTTCFQLDVLANQLSLKEYSETVDNSETVDTSFFIPKLELQEFEIKVQSSKECLLIRSRVPDWS